MADNVELEARLDTAAAEGLSAKLSPLVGKDISLDGSCVEQLGGRCLEVLLTARHLTVQAGLCFELQSPSKALIADLATFGLGPDEISTGGTT